jgi:hypothetical protein
MQINTNFLMHEQGGMTIMFDDPNFVRSETIIFDQSTGVLHAVLEDKPVSIGHVSGALAAAFTRQAQKQSKIQLSSLRVDGSVLDLEANFIVIH